MAFLSEILDRTVTDQDGQYVGKLVDLVAHEPADFIHPQVDAVVIRGHAGRKVVPYGEVMSLFAPTIPLRCFASEIPNYTPNDQDVFLSRDVMDKQIIDTDGARVVRVNDLELVRVNGDLYVSNVDIGLSGILRRLGLETPARVLASTLRLSVPQNFISWDDVELLRHDQFMRLRVPAESLADLHPADVAEILSDMNKHETGQLLEAMGVEQIADALEQVETEFQVSLVEHMADEKVADVLEEMEPDEAADLLAELPEERSRVLVSLMEKDEAEEVRMLLRYPEDAAGGIMTTEYAYVAPDMTASQTVEFLRNIRDQVETFFYIYVLDVEDHLVGVFSLTNLLFADPSTPVRDFMEERVKTVHPMDRQDEVAQVITKYDLIAVPVTDEKNVMLGIVTADDALDKIIPTAWKKRLPRFFR